MHINVDCLSNFFRSQAKMSPIQDPSHSKGCNETNFWCVGQTKEDI